MKRLRVGLSIALLAGLSAAGRAGPEPETVAQLLSRMEARAAQLEATR